MTIEKSTTGKKILNFTIAEFIGIIIFCIPLIWAVFSFTHTTDNKIDLVNAKIDKLETSVNNKFDMVYVTMNNQNKSDKNDRKRDSADFTNRFKTQDIKLDGIQTSLDRLNFYNKGTVTSN